MTTVTTVVVIIVVCIASLAILHHQLYYHFRAVDKQKLYRCGKLSQPAFRLIVNSYKIKTVINLIGITEYNAHWFVQQKSFCENNCVNYFPIPITTSSTSSNTQPDKNHIQQLIDIFDNRDNYPILVHCKQGVLRTGLAVAIYQRNYCNMDNKTILAQMPNFGHDFQSPRYESFRWFILSYKSNKDAED